MLSLFDFMLMTWSSCHHVLQLLDVCAEYGERYDIKFNLKKSVVMIMRTGEQCNAVFPVFHLSGRDVAVVEKVKYLGHIVRSDLSDNDVIQRQYCKLYAQANMLARKFGMCTEIVKNSIV